MDNSLIIHGDRMTDRSTARYLITLTTQYIDVFGIEQFHKVNFHLNVVHLNHPKLVDINDPIMFRETDSNNTLYFDELL